MASAYSSIILDLGGVVIETEPAKTLETFRILGVDHIDPLFQEFIEQGILENLETGKMSYETFRDLFQARLEEPIENKWFDEAWDAMLIGIPPQRIELLEQLRQQFPLYLLSNTNTRHVQRINQYLESAYQIPGLEHLFDRCFYSYECGLRKPDPEIFRMVADLLDLEPQQVLYLDDTEENLIAAEKLGFQIELIHREYPLEEYFSWP